MEKLSATEIGLIMVVGVIGVVAASYQEWPTAGAIATGAFAILKGRN